MASQPTTSSDYTAHAHAPAPAADEGHGSKRKALLGLVKPLLNHAMGRPHAHSAGTTTPPPPNGAHHHGGMATAAPSSHMQRPPPPLPPVESLLLESPLSSSRPDQQSQQNGPITALSSIEFNPSTVHEAMDSALIHTQTLATSILVRVADAHEANGTADPLTQRQLDALRHDLLGASPQPHLAHLSFTATDARAYLTSVLGRAILPHVAAWLPRTASAHADRAAARDLWDAIKRAQAAGRLAGDPVSELPEHLREKVVRAIVDAVLPHFVGVDVTPGDLHRIANTVLACALAVAAMRVVHPRFELAWPDRHEVVEPASVKVPPMRTINVAGGGGGGASGSATARVAFTVWPRVATEATEIKHSADVYRAVVVAYTGSDLASLTPVAAVAPERPVRLSPALPVRPKITTPQPDLTARQPALPPRPATGDGLRPELPPRPPSALALALALAPLPHPSAATTREPDSPQVSEFDRNGGGEAPACEAGVYPEDTYAADEPEPEQREHDALDLSAHFAIDLARDERDKRAQVDHDLALDELGFMMGTVSTWK
ncbi:hypothetical protein H9P43_003972 [Blastocladiella emersonii ATCC 22665]|nr:hypothetical protein H9P43_003972 [Blastocladiella emersonii ATCC 22665]